MRSSKMTPFQTHMDMSENMVYHGLSWFIAIFPIKIDWNNGNGSGYAPV